MAITTKKVSGSCTSTLSHCEIQRRDTTKNFLWHLSPDGVPHTKPSRLPLKKRIQFARTSLTLCPSCRSNAPSNRKTSYLLQGIEIRNPFPPDINANLT